VLKYIKDNEWVFVPAKNIDNIVVTIIAKEKEYIIANKPLHLYTEQEEKDLLELLNKL
jgi:hypothetical protein